MLPDGAIGRHHPVAYERFEDEISEGADAERLKVGGVDGLDVARRNGEDLSVTKRSRLESLPVDFEKVLQVGVEAADLVALEDLGIDEIEAEKEIFLGERRRAFAAPCAGDPGHGSMSLH